jgi:hypothetical protein
VLRCIDSQERRDSAYAVLIWREPCVAWREAGQASHSLPSLPHIVCLPCLPASHSVQGRVESG